VNPAGRRSFYRDGDRRLLAYVERTGEGAHNDPVRTCNGKFRHATWRSAAVEAQRMTLKGQGQCRAYRCPFCDRWHVGHIQTQPVHTGHTPPAAPAVGSPPHPLAPAPATHAQRGPAENRRRYAEVARLIGAGHTPEAACDRLNVDVGKFQLAWAQERARQAVEAGGETQATETTSPVRPPGPIPRSRPGTQLYALLYNRWRRRQREPGWASVPSPRLSRAKPVLRLEHLALLTDAERQALFPAPADRDREPRP
jgi:hypothetical protein